MAAKKFVEELLTGRHLDGHGVGSVTITGNAFHEVDKDGDGLISREDFGKLMTKHGVTDAKDVKACFDAVNQDGTGMIKYSEFVAAMVAESTYTSDAQIEAAFARLDQTWTGVLDSFDLKHMLGKKVSAGTMEGMLLEADETGDGQITLAEFKRVIRSEAARNAPGAADSAM